MFGMGGSEILVILIVALLFLGPDKLPEAAKQISKGIRDIKKQSRALQRTIEDDEHIGGAIRDLKSALRGEDEPIRPPVAPILPAAAVTVSLPEHETPELAALPKGEPATGAAAGAAADAGDPIAADASAAFAGAAAVGNATAGTAQVTGAGVAAGADGVPARVASSTVVAGAADGGASSAGTATSAAAAEAPVLRMSPTAGEADEAAPRSTAADDAVLAALVRPAPNTIARATVRPIAKPAVVVAPSLATPASPPARPALAVTAPAVKPVPAASQPDASAATEPAVSSEPKHG